MSSHTCAKEPQYTIMATAGSGSHDQHADISTLMVKLAEARLAHDPVAREHATGLGRLRELRAANTQVLVEAFGTDDKTIRLSEALMATRKVTTSHRQLTSVAVDIACNRFTNGITGSIEEFLGQLKNALQEHTTRSGSTSSIKILEVGPQHQHLPVTQQNYLADVGVELEAIRAEIQGAEERRRASCGELARAVADCKAQLRDALVTGRHQNLSAEVLTTRLQASLHMPPPKKQKHNVAWLKRTLLELGCKGNTLHQGRDLVEFMRRELKQRINAGPPATTKKKQPLSWENPAALRLRFRMVRSCS